MPYLIAPLTFYIKRHNLSTVVNTNDHQIFARESDAERVFGAILLPVLQSKRQLNNSAYIIELLLMIIASNHPISPKTLRTKATIVQMFAITAIIVTKVFRLLSIRHHLLSFRGGSAVIQLSF